MVVLMKAGIQRRQGIIEAKNAVFFGNLEFGLAVQIFRNQPQIGRKEFRSASLSVFLNAVTSTWTVME